jgi:hypothetical protein
MSKRKPKGTQLDAINRGSQPFQVTFDLLKQDQFVNSLGVDFIHYKAMPSPIGLKDRGDYRRSDGLDTISSNGMLYFKAGCFTATMVDNSKSQKASEGALLDYSTSRLIMPRFYNTQEEQSDGKRIYMAPGDRVYIADPAADILVPNYQRMDYEPDTDNVPMFPIAQIEFVEDSRGIIYQEGRDFEITCQGNIRWIPSGQNPGIDPDTKKGRVYSTRYLYKAFWYVVAIPKEVRVTNVTNGDERVPERMAYHAVVQREYIYLNVNRGQNSDGSTGAGDVKTQDQKRIVKKPKSGIDPGGPSIKVNMDDIEQES